MLSTSDSEVDDAIKSAIALHSKLHTWLAANHPALYEESKEG